jgi:hypothetical protein
MAGTLALTGWSGRPAWADTPDKLPANLQATATNLSPGWMASTIGTTDTIAEPQSVSVDATGVTTIVASGKDLWNSDDGGVFVYMKHTGDGSVSFHLISQTGGQDASGTDTGWVKTSASFRETLDSASRNVRIDASSGNMLLPTARVNAGDTPLHPGDAGSQGVGYTGPGSDTTPNAGRPIGSGVWLGVDRHRDVFSFYWSNDGKVWTKIAGLNLQLPADLLAGIEASAHKDDPTDKTIPPQTSKLDRVSVSSQLLASQSITNIGFMAMDKSALVTWNPVSIAAGAVTYNVYMVDPAHVNNPTKLTAAPIKESSFLVPNLTNGTPYLFGVSAVVDGVESGIQLPEPTASAQNTLLPNVVPGPPVLAGFTFVNIGTASTGTVTLTSGKDLASAAIHLKASGWDMYQQADGFSFLAMPMAGDLDVSARFVKGPTEDADGGGWELGGPIFRETLDAGSRFVMAQIAATQVLQFKRREQQYATPTNTGVARNDNTARPVTMRVVRKGDLFHGYYSEDDGKTWKDLGDPTVGDPGSSTGSKDTLTGFSKTPWVGIALSGHTEGEFTEADIDHIVIKQAQ